ncbi:hypothetical protein LVD17_00340 [Fulvivirga ulvae]|uniref:hypothetical protein n=1 Tax=Fulvivirga ulvae TaxID=2904245 RepID=UPI001F2A0DD1|nr:hypothetical protein [Fulvivirga ulvae]UII32285.1 hypothetical protein LVD17_00340 [Fulvivirga ulvae]
MKDNIKIKPVIELCPSEYAKKEYDYPNGTAKEFADGWNKYWLKSLSDSGIDAVMPCILGYFFIEVSKISDRNLEIILKGQLENEKVEGICPLDGGLVIFVDDVPVVQPQCCSSLSDYQNWIDVINETSSEWKEVWIGHPMIYLRILNNKLQFSELTEDSVPKERVVNEFDFSLFQRELKRAIEEIEDFKKRVERTLERLEYSQIKRISYTLINNMH